MEKKKHYWNAIAIAILGGALGLQEFYLNRNIFGILCVLFCWTYIPLIIAFIEAIVWLFEGEEKFDNRFNTPKDNNKQLLTD